MCTCVVSHCSGPFDTQLVYEDMPQESGSYLCKRIYNPTRSKTGNMQFAIYVLWQTESPYATPLSSFRLVYTFISTNIHNSEM